MSGGYQPSGPGPDRPPKNPPNAGSAGRRLTGGALPNVSSPIGPFSAAVLAAGGTVEARPGARRRLRAAVAIAGSIVAAFVLGLAVGLLLGVSL